MPNGATSRAGRRGTTRVGPLGGVHAAAAPATAATAAGAPALTGLESSSIRASLMMRRGSYWRGSYFFQSTSSMSMPTSSLICSRAPEAMRRTSFTRLASFWVYSGSRCGPITRMPMISRRKNSGPLIPNTLGRLPFPEAASGDSAPGGGAAGTARFTGSKGSQSCSVRAAAGGGQGLSRHSTRGGTRRLRAAPPARALTRFQAMREARRHRPARREGPIRR